MRARPERLAGARHARLRVDDHRPVDRIAQRREREQRRRRVAAGVRDQRPLGRLHLGQPVAPRARGGPVPPLRERVVAQPVDAAEVDDDRVGWWAEEGGVVAAEAEEDHVGPAPGRVGVRAEDRQRAVQARVERLRRPAGERVGAERDRLELGVARSAGRASPGRCSRRCRGWRRLAYAYYAQRWNLCSKPRRAAAQARLVLEDGTVFPGSSIGAPGVASGEACFTTAMTGYEEAVTDPSYVAQVLCFAYPLIGTYGVDESRLESDRVQCEGVVMRDARPEFAAWLAPPRRRRADRRRHAHARAEDPRRRRPALRARRGDGRGAARAGARRAADRRPAARPPGRRDRGRTRSAPGPASSSSTSARSARSRAGSPTPGSRPTSCRGRGTRTRSSRPSRARC